MRARLKWFSALALVLAGAPSVAADFDHYLLALSWSPSWCAAEGEASGAEQCERDLGFALHGLWPQHAEGWPEYCDTTARDPSRAETAAMADVMGSGGLAWHQWKKHGRCSGLDPADYFALARAALAQVALPRFAAGRASADAVEAAFLAANPELEAEHLVVTCRSGRIAEVRICLTRALEPRGCAPDVAADACRDRGPLAMPPAR
jgi:ribonuclease T2